jgi:hypothetical protein
MTPKTGTKKIVPLLLASVTSLVALGLAALVIGYARFSRLIRRDVEALLAQARRGPERIVTEDMLKDLPEPVRRYLTYTGIVGKPLAQTVYIKQQGQMHPGAELPWIPLDFETYYSVEPPGFVWDGTMHVGPLPLARARDLYRNGTGNMLVKAASLVTVVDGKGEEMDLGSMMRFLSEMVWFPSAFLSDNISFEPVDNSSARVTFTHRGRSVSGTLYIDEEGRLTNFVAKQYRTVGGGYELTPWSTPITGYGEFAGLKLPVKGRAVWHLKDGDLEYINSAIIELEYNRGS